MGVEEILTEKNSEKIVEKHKKYALKRIESSIRWVATFSLKRFLNKENLVLIELCKQGKLGNPSDTTSS